MSNTRASRRGLTRVLAAAGTVAAAGGIAAGAASSAGAAAAQPLSFVAAWSSPDVLAVPIAAAIEKGYYTKAGIDFKLILPPSNSTDEQMVGIGQADLGASTVTDMVDARQAGLPIISIANESNVNNWGIFWNPGQKVNAQTFANGGVGGYGDTFTNAMLPFFDKHFKVSPSKVKVVTVTNDDIPLLIDHKIAFATSTTNFGAVEYQQTTHHKPAMLLARQVGAPNSPIWIYIGNKKWMASHKAETTAFLNATLEATKWATANPVAATHLYEKYFKSTGYNFQHDLGEWKATAAALKSTSGRYFVAEASQWAALAKALKSIGSLKTVYPANQYFTNAYIGKTR